jgi:hypothetical protein
VDTLFTIIAIIAILFGFVVFFGAPYVPSKRRELERALDELYPVGDADVLVDVGSGDGVVLREAATRGVKRAVGYELNPIFVALSSLLSRKYKNVQVRLGNMWHMKFPDDTTIVYAFAVARDSKKLARKMQLEARRLGRPLLLMTFGLPTLAGREPERRLGAHALYRFE